MSVIPKFWGLHAKTPRRLKITLGVIPFLLLIVFYLSASKARLAVNPDDKLLPSPVKMIESVHHMAFTEDKRSGQYLMWRDTAASLRRLGIGISMAAFCATLLGINMGLFAGMRAVLLPFVTFISIIPPLALLPILFIAFGVDELAKVMLIFLGTFPVMTRDIYLATQTIPVEQITKALTLGASQLEVVYRVVFPQIFPKVVEAIRLSLGGAWLFLIASEAIASTDGLGYRIFLVRRYLAMDTIIPYALWITFLGFSIDFLLKRGVNLFFPWYAATTNE